MRQSDDNKSLVERMNQAVKSILDTTQSREELLKNLIRINRVFTEISDVRGEETEEAKSNNLILPSGLAISPEFAAMNLRDLWRTVKYLRGLKNAIDECLLKFPNQKIHILYPGCGPYGTLVLPLLTQYRAEQLKVTLLEIQDKSLLSVRKICEKLNFYDFITGITKTDASTYQHPKHDPVHIAVMECMLHSLAREPQVSISRNFSQQLVENGILVPEEVHISLYMVDPEIEFKSHISEQEKINSRLFLGDVFTLDKNSHELKCNTDEQNSIKYLQAANINLPDNLVSGKPLMLFTQLKIFKDTVLRFYESGITHPFTIGQQDNLISGDQLSFRYALTEYPEFYYEVIKSDPWS